MNAEVWQAGAPWIVQGGGASHRAAALDEAKDRLRLRGDQAIGACERLSGQGVRYSEILALHKGVGVDQGQPPVGGVTLPAHERVGPNAPDGDERTEWDRPPAEGGGGEGGLR